jgi:hypothetical protein
LRTWLASLAAVVVAAVTALLLPTGGLAPTGPWKRFPDGGWAYVRVDAQGTGMVLEGEPGGRSEPCIWDMGPLTVHVQESADRIVLAFERRHCMYTAPVPTRAPLGHRTVVTSDGYWLPVLSEAILPQPTYASTTTADSLAHPGEPALYPVGGDAPRPNFLRAYTTEKGHRILVGATLDDGHVTRPGGRHVTVQGHDIIVAASPPPPGYTFGGEYNATWVDHGWVVFLEMEYGYPTPGEEEMIGVLNGLYWPT